MLHSNTGDPKRTYEVFTHPEVCNFFRPSGLSAWSFLVFILYFMSDEDANPAIEDDVEAISFFSLLKYSLS